MSDMWNKLKKIALSSKDLAMLGSGNVLATGISGIFWFYIASLIEVDSYGEISYFIAIASLVGVISTVGAQNTITVFTAKGEKIVQELAFVSLMTGLISSIILFLIFFNIGASLYVIGYILFAIISSEILGRKFYKTYAKYMISQRILMILLAIGFYYLIGNDGVIIGLGLSFFVYSYRLLKDRKNLNFDLSKLKPKKNFIIHNYATDLASILTGSLDKIIIAPLFGFIILGNYQLGIQFLTVLLLIPSIVYQYILPQDSSGIRNKKLKLILIITSIFISGFGIILSPIVIPVLFPKFSETIQVVQIISLILIPHSFIIIFQSQFLALLKSKIVLFGNIIFVMVQIPSIIILGNIFGINGIALGMVFASLGHAVFYAISNKRIQNKII
jgi:O-antigen/teichoic acid export membrane protein